MAIALPSYASGQIAAVGVNLPRYASGEIAFSGLTLPKYAAGEIAFVGVKLPTYGSGENMPTSLTVTPTGGVLVGGRANTVGDPDIIPSGGVLVGGSATVAAVLLSITDYYPLGGAKVGGTAPNSFYFTTWIPSGGVWLAGSATVTSFSVQPFAPVGGVALGGSAASALVVIYNITAVDAVARTGTPIGGVTVGGNAVIAENILVVGLGGCAVGGAAIVLDRLPYTPQAGVLVGGAALVGLVSNITGVGGVLVGGAATVVISVAHTPSGGVLVGGGGIIKDYQALHVVSGGVLAGGAAVIYMVPSGTVVTAENPTNETFDGWAFNHDTGAPSRYKQLPATSIFTYNGVPYITAAGGVYALDAVSDMGRNIVATFTTPKLDFNKSLDKKVPVIYMGAKTNANMQVRVTVNKNSPLYYIFADSTAKGGSVRGMRTTTGKGLKGRYWQFQFGNVNGADFEFDAVELTPTTLERHGA